MAAPKSKLNLGGSEAYKERHKAKVFAPHIDWKSEKAIEREKFRRRGNTSPTDDEIVRSIMKRKSKKTGDQAKGLED